MKRIIPMLLILVLIISLSCGVSAANHKVIDEVGLLTSRDIEELEQIAQNLSDVYQLDAAIVIVDSLDGKTVEAYADDYYDYNGYGVGEESSGVLLLIAMNERKWHVTTHAEGTTAVTYEELGSLEEDMVNFLTEGDYYNAFMTYLGFLQSEFDFYRTYECGFTLKGFATSLMISIVIGAVVSGIVILIMRSGMNTVKKQYGAGTYIVDDSYDLYRCQDIFLYSRTTKTRKAESSSGSSSGGSRTHTSSSGRSHGGRGGSF